MYSIVIQSPESWKLNFRAFQFQNFLGEHAHRKKGNNVGLLADTVGYSIQTCWLSIIIETPGFVELTLSNTIFNTTILLPHFYTVHSQNLHPCHGFWSRRAPCFRRFVQKLYFLFKTREPKNPIFLAQQWSQ